jgi:hypothetical protein
VITLSHDPEINSAMWSVLTALDFLNAMLLTENLHRAHRVAAALCYSFARPISEG